MAAVNVAVVAVVAGVQIVVQLLDQFLGDLLLCEC